MKKRPAKPQLRITGVVKAMNLARERLSTGIPPSELDAFRQWVRTTVAGIEQICRKHKTSPDQLSTPTYHAYLFLKELNLEDLPVRDNPDLPVKQKVRVTNLIAVCNDLQKRMAELVNGTAQDSNNIRLQVRVQAPVIEELRRYIQAQVSHVEAIYQQTSSGPGELPARSRRAYQWLVFLSSEENLQAHLAGLKIGSEAGRQAACRAKLPLQRRNLPVKLEFFHLSALYRAKLQKIGLQQDGLHIVANEGFITAPQAILEALICAALSGNSSPHLSQVRGYAETEAFSEILMDLGVTGANTGPVTRGRHYDLQEVFERVNAAYFDGRLDPPRLAWNRTITHRKLGHYQPVTDSVMISITLDQPRVPTYVIDFVMYHELLHKDLGIRLANGKRYAHTKAFRQEERKFEYYTQAQEFLNQLGQKPIL